VEVRRATVMETTAAQVQRDVLTSRGNGHPRRKGDLPVLLRARLVDRGVLVGSGLPAVEVVGELLVRGHGCGSASPPWDLARWY